MQVVQAKEREDLKGSDSQEYAFGVQIAGLHRERNNAALGEVLTLAELALDGDKLEAFKKAVKPIFWQLTDRNQHTVYYVLGVEAQQYGDPDLYDQVCKNKCYGREGCSECPPRYPTESDWKGATPQPIE